MGETIEAPRVTQQPSWFPDWSNCAVVIVASGPSAKKVDLSVLSKKARVRVIAIKRSHELCQPDMIYGCDYAWWHSMRGLPKYRGLRVAYDPMLREPYPFIHLIDIERHKDKVRFDPPGLVASGGNSGFQALNLAAQFGTKMICLVGFDMHDKSGLHWYGRNEWDRANNPQESNFRRWRDAFTLSAPILSNMGIDVANATRHSEAKAFRSVPSIEVALAEWKI